MLSISLLEEVKPAGIEDDEIVPVFSKNIDTRWVEIVSPGSSGGVQIRIETRGGAFSR